MKCKRCKTRDALEGKKWCQLCADTEAQRIREKADLRKSRSECRGCGRPSKVAFCRICTLKRIASNNLKDRSRAKEIGLLLHKQGHRCAYTGLPLILGINASIDHIVPRSQGGTNEITNLQWVDTRINRMRGTMADAEFKVFLVRLAQSIMQGETYGGISVG